MFYKIKYFHKAFNATFWPTGDEGSMPADIATLLKTSMGLWNKNCELSIDEEISTWCTQGHLHYDDHGVYEHL